MIKFNQQEKSSRVVRVAVVVVLLLFPLLVLLRLPLKTSIISISGRPLNGQRLTPITSIETSEPFASRQPYGNHNTDAFWTQTGTLMLRNLDASEASNQQATHLRTRGKA